MFLSTRITELALAPKIVENSKCTNRVLYQYNRSLSLIDMGKETPIINTGQKVQESQNWQFPEHSLIINTGQKVQESQNWQFPEHSLIINTGQKVQESQNWQFPEHSLIINTGQKVQESQNWQFPEHSLKLKVGVSDLFRCTGFTGLAEALRCLKFQFGTCIGRNTGDTKILFV